MALRKMWFACAAVLTVGLISPAFAAETTATVKADAKTTASGDLKPIDIKIPKPVFVGTPKAIKGINNLEPPQPPRGPFLAPKDVVNLAKGKEVTGSDEEPILGELELITDEDKEAAEGSYAQFQPGVQYVQIDLGQESELFAVVLWHFHQQARVYHDVIVRVADDADFVSNVKTIFNNDDDNSAKLGVGKDLSYIETNDGKLIDAKGVKGRYVRLYSNGNTANEMNDYTEVEVYGRPVKK